MAVEKIIRLHARSRDGTLDDLREEFSLADCADTLPSPGDFIVSPWVGRGEREPNSRMVYEVQSRYFLPNAHGDDVVYVAVVVKPRPGTEEERCVLGVS